MTARLIGDVRRKNSHSSRRLESSLVAFIGRMFWLGNRALSNRRDYAVPVWMVLSLAAEREVGFPKIARALELIGEYHPRTLARLRALADGVIVFDIPGTQGSWLQAVRLVRLSEKHVLGADTAPEHIAATIAHEVAHAWLISRGIKYSPDQRHRVEAFCYRSEAALARRLPGCEKLAEYYEATASRTVANGPAPWSKERRIERDLRALEGLGVPGWMRSLLRRTAQRGSA